MKRNGFVGLVLAMLFLSSVSYAQTGSKEIHKTFPKKETVRIKTASGDCVVRKGKRNQIEVDVISSVRPESAFEAEFEERDAELEIVEKWHGSGSGSVRWTVSVPEGTNVRFSTASGELSVEGLQSDLTASTASGEVAIADMMGEISVATASGDVLLENCTGEIDCSTASGEIEGENLKGRIECSTASGDIDLVRCAGEIECSCASGDIDVSEIAFEEKSEFSTASGDVRISLSDTPDVDLECSTASGKIILDYQGLPVKGTFVFTARKDRGRIQSPFPFDEEEEYWQGGRPYMRKTFTMGDGAPRIRLSTASGDAILK